MLPSLTSSAGFSGFLISGSSLNTSSILLTLAELMVIMTNIMDSIIRDIMMDMM